MARCSCQGERNTYTGYVRPGMEDIREQVARVVLVIGGSRVSRGRTIELGQAIGKRRNMLLGQR